MIRFLKLPFYQLNKVQAHEQSQSQSTCEERLEVKRDLTDRPYLLLLCISGVCWFILSLYAYCAGDQIAVDYANVLYHVQMRQVSIFLIYCISEMSHVLVWDFVLSVFILSIFAALCRWATKVVIYLFIVLAFIMLPLLLFIFYCFFEFADYGHLIIITVIATMYALALYVLRKTGIDLICKVIRESCKAIFAYPSTLCIVILQFILYLVAFAYFVSIFAFLYSIRNENFRELFRYSNGTSDDTNGTEGEIGKWIELKMFVEDSVPDNYTSVPPHVYLLHVINVMCFFWILLFISGVARMILTSTFAFWYNNKSERQSPITTVPTFFTTILRYHLGTAAYASSIFALGPIIKIVHENSRDVLQKIYKQPILIISWFTVVMNCPFDALAVCAIHGREFCESVKVSYNLQTKNLAFYLAMNTVSQIVIFLGCLLVPFTSMILAGLWVNYNLEYYLHLENTYDIIGEISAVTTILPIFLSLIFFTTFHAASETIQLCYFEDSKNNQEDEKQLYEIQVDDFKNDDI